MLVVNSPTKLKQWRADRVVVRVDGHQRWIGFCWREIRFGDEELYQSVTLGVGEQSLTTLAIERNHAAMFNETIKTLQNFIDRRPTVGSQLPWLAREAYR